MLLIAYAIGLSSSWWLAFQLRFDFAVPTEYTVHIWTMVGIAVALKLIALFAFGQFGALLSYFGLHDLGKILVSCGVVAGVSLIVWLECGVPYAPPRAVIMTDFLTSFLFLCGLRVSLRLARERYPKPRDTNRARRRVIIIGAGDVGASLARDFQSRRGLGMTPIAFYDDNPVKWGTRIHGILVRERPESIKNASDLDRIDEAIIAMPSASARRVREIVQLLGRLHIRSQIVPSYEELLSGKVRTSQLRPVEIQDLLGRASVNLSTDLIKGFVHGHIILITGAGGSIGSELSRQIAKYGPRQLLLIERSEYLLFQIEQELRDLGYDAELVPLVADITDLDRMRCIFRRFSPSAVFHAAAHKHVPMMELQPTEAFTNNTLGSRLLAELAIEHHVERFIMISTDKAINPTNVMGATKRMAELYLQALHKEAARKTKIMAVRFGNVLGSSGSVIPTFKKQIVAGGPVTVTHPDVTRYFMTVNEAVGLVLQSATQGIGGEIFVLDMGQPMKISDLAKQLIELSGLEPNRDIEIKYTGLRPGEKLYEELTHNTENVIATDHPKILRYISEPRSLKELQLNFSQLDKLVNSVDGTTFKLAIKKIVPEYQPHLTLE